jgi:hypothetical protein
LVLRRSLFNRCQEVVDRQLEDGSNSRPCEEIRVCEWVDLVVPLPTKEDLGRFEPSSDDSGEYLVDNLGMRGC